MSIIRIPSEEEAKKAFEGYALAVGKVAHAWNYLHEKLGQLFVVISGADRQVALSIWYSNNSDRTQRKVMQAAVLARADDRWPNQSAKEDLKWLLDRADDLAKDRNNAIHAPCSLFIGVSQDGGGAEMGAAYHHGNPLARRLVGKSLQREFEWSEACAEVLSRFTQRIEFAFNYPDRYSWPERPALPERQDA
jgi:hypothetical protein